MDETELLTPEQAEKAWWDAWYAEDYSWEGLAKKPWEGFSVTNSGHVVVNDSNMMYNNQAVPWTGHAGNEIKRPATIQDFWSLDHHTSELRSSEIVSLELLKAEDGNLYHVAHFPYKNKDGSFSEKKNWEPAWFEPLVRYKLLNTISSQFGQYDPPSMEPPGRIDWRAQFQGTSLISDIGIPENSISIFFKQTCYCIDANFQHIHLGNGAYFNNSLFYKNANFSRCSIGNNSFFEFCTFLGAVNFYNSQLVRCASFKDSKFFGNGDFSNAVFHNTSFENSKFLLSSTDKSNEKIDFSNTQFLQEAKFNGTIADCLMNFSNCSFKGAAIFKNVIIINSINFDNTTFESHVNFYNASSLESFFRNCKFLSISVFDKATFNIHANFSHAKFDHPVHFNTTKFLGKINFNDAVFSDVAHFDNIVWPSTPALWTDAFDRAHFKSHAVFTGAKCRSFAAFNGAKLERGIRFDPGDEVSNNQTFEKELAPKSAENRDALLLSLEGGCRVLKQAMAYASDPLREQEFYRFELKARRAQTRSLPSEKFVSRAYELVSDYGSSIFRPVWWAVGLVPLFALLYVVIAVSIPTILNGWPIDWSLVGHAVNFSAARMVPFGAFEAVSKEWIGAQTHFSFGTLLGIRLLATFQTLLSVGLIFLSGLALRRKFQMS